LRKIRFVAPWRRPLDLKGWLKMAIFKKATCPRCKRRNHIYEDRDKEKYLECKSKESYYYKKRFNDKFNKTKSESWNVIPHYWLPNWIETNGEPSARVLSLYK